MSKKSDKNLIVGLDIGTSKVVAIVCEVTPDDEVEVIGIGSNPSKGLKKGVVVNIESTVQSIQRAIEEAELMAGCQIQSVYAGIAGSHIRSLNSHGIVAIRDKEVVQGDVDRVIDAARAVAIPADQKILHILPQEFVIDKQEGIREPIGMAGVRLEAKVHLVTGAVSAAQNIIKCVLRCGLEVDDIILEQLASSYSVLTEDEKELVVCIVDIGGGTSDFTLLASDTSNSLRGYQVLGTSGIHIGGTNIDQVLAFKKIMPELGMNTLMQSMNGTNITIPSTWFLKLSTWHQINGLYQPAIIKNIQHSIASALDTKRTTRLIKVLEKQYGHRILEDVEHCKIRLSESDRTTVSLDEIENGLHIEVNKREFERIIEPVIVSIRDKIDELVSHCGLRNDSIDYVFYTGGTTLIPMVQHTINMMFPNSQALTGDMLHSVGIGLTLDAEEKFGCTKT